MILFILLDIMDKRVVICTPVRNGENYLESFLNGILNLDYDSLLIDLFFHTNDNIDRTEEILLSFKELYEDDYQSIVVEKKDFGALQATTKAMAQGRLANTMSTIYNRLLSYARTIKDIDYYFYTDCDHELSNKTLSLMKHEKDIIAPLLYRKRIGKLFNNLYFLQNGIIQSIPTLAKGPSIPKQEITGVHKCYAAGGIYFFSKKVLDLNINYTGDNNIQWDLEIFERLNKLFEVYYDADVVCNHM